tara:strand:- start:365 stop:658 length:294 start_codon:yes stop_codon:yes gene_type:complete
MIYANGSLDINGTTYSTSDGIKFQLVMYPNSVFVLTDNSDASAWISAKGLTSISKSAAQALVDTSTSNAQSRWDALSDEEKLVDYGGRPRPQAVVLP